ncbi:MAG TPA: type II secretion system minor pseudopilin GspK [Burkholderiaceae bacterium]|nr:type II secretion system minor pseudopilin GspK [Burkholderiaceae bacterium]
MKAHRRSPPRGAALLLAMLILTLVTTLAAGMVWQQWRAIRVEAAERARTQAAWILAGALDWARLILREDARNRGADHLGEPWAVPLAEARLSTFLAADRDNNNAADTDALDAFLSGSIVDAQARWNLRRLVGSDGKPVEAEQRVLARLCEFAGAGTDAAERIAAALQKAWSPLAGSQDEAQIAPQRLAELAWLGIDADTLRRLAPFVVILPSAETRVNVNTAPAEVIAAAVDGMSLGQAQRLVQERTRTVITDVASAPARAWFPAETNPPNPKLFEGVGVSSSHFFVSGRLRLESRVLEERTLIQRRDLDMVVLLRERVSLRDAP